MNAIHLEGLAEEKRPNVTSRIANELGRSIVAGRYQNVPFPIEADISVQFGSSRSVTREAIKMLSAKGLIVSRPRHGTSVASQKSWNFFDTDVLRWILDNGFNLDILAEFTAFRMAIEPQAAALAIRRGDPDAMMTIRRAIERMEMAEQNPSDALASDIGFHVAILEASGNRFMQQCRDLVSTALKFSIQMTNTTKGVSNADLDAHRAIADAILAGDMAAAVRSSQELLAEAANLIDLARKRSTP